MSYITKEDFFATKWFKSYALIIVGCFILSLGLTSLYHIVRLGCMVFGIVVNFLTEGMFPSLGAENGGFPIGTLGLILNIPLTIIGIKLLGPKFGVKAVVGFVLCTIFMDYVGITGCCLDW